MDALKLNEFDGARIDFLSALFLNCECVREFLDLEFAPLEIWYEGYSNFLREKVIPYVKRDFKRSVDLERPMPLLNGNYARAVFEGLGYGV